MIIDYDHNPNITEERRLQSLKESVQMALNEMDASEKASQSKAVDTSKLIDMFYPVGSYYETSDSTFDPNVSWGGRWVLESGGRVHVSSGTTEANSSSYWGSDVTNKEGNAASFTIGESGGETKHLIDWAEAGQKPLFITQGGHTHSVNSYYRNTANYGSGGSAARPYTASGSSSTTNWATIDDDTGQHSHSVEGSSAYAAHNNMPPYIVVNRWHRTA